jgi:hypothetical protein
MTDSARKEIQEVTKAQLARGQLNCVAQYLNSAEANRVAARFAEVLTKELPPKTDLSERVCLVHVIHAAILILLDRMYKLRGYTREEWIDEYTQLVQLLNVEVKALLEEQQEARTENKESTASAEAN